MTCEQIIARMWVDSYSPLDRKFEKDVLVMPEQKGSAVDFIIIDYQARPYILDEFAWELKEFIEKKLEAVRVE